MKNNDLISIIISIYDAEPYLKRCLDSILSQTYKDLEIILINDGSIDGSLKICKEYSQIDDRIQVVNFKQNLGVSRGRNEGLKIAKGKYVSFIDADDTIEKTFIETLYNICETSSADIGIVNVNYYYESKIKRPLKLENKIIQKDEYYRLLIGDGKGFAANKLYRKSIIDNVFFDESIRICEDLLFNVEVAKKVKYVSVKNDYLYNYYQNSNGAYLSTYNIKKVTEIDAFDRILNIIKEDSPENMIYYQCQYLRMAINQRNQYIDSKYDDSMIYTRIQTSISKYYKTIMSSPKISTKEKIYIWLSHKHHKFFKQLKLIKNRVNKNA